MSKEKENYKHLVDKKMIPTCTILGVNIAAIDMEWLISFTCKHIKELSGDYICVSNVHTTVMSYEDHDYRKIQNGGIMAIPDGGPLSSLGRKYGFSNMQRTTGPDYMDELFKCSVINNYKHYFYGSTGDTLCKMCDKLKEKYPGIQIVGRYSPPFSENVEVDIEAMDDINKLEPDFVWVGLGAPKQEKWMALHQGKVHGLMIGVGAGFDYFAGNIKRAPKWMQIMNLEWLYRLLQDPKRLLSRYLYTNTRFILEAVIKRR